MSYASQLHSYIAEVRQRLRLGAWVRGAAIFAGTALAVTVLLVLALNHFAFPLRGVLWARAGILLALSAAAAFGMALPVVRLTRTRAVQRAEAAHPELNERLTTFEDRAQRGNDPFLELLAADTLRQTENVPPAILIPKDRLWALGGAAVACLAVLVGMIAAGPGFLGYGASLLWTGAKKNAAPYYAIAVTPGNVTVRRNSDELVVARVTGMQPGKAQIFARFQSASAWEPATMQQVADAGGGASYQFVLAGLPENVEYYVAAGPLRSSHYKIKVLDLPGIRQISVTYRYPAWTGMKPVTEEHSGDLRAIEGTDAEIRIETDRPLKEGQFALDSGQTVELAGGASNVYTGSIHMDKDGAYHLSASSDGQAVRLSEDYFIATNKALPPQIAIDRPAGDYRASPIEEVTVGVKAQGEFGLKDMHLHYAVNGGADHDVSLLDAPGAKDAGGQHMIPLEELKLVPGDVIAVYATARDGHSEARTDISFIQVDPFEREFSQSQQSGGGGGGGAGGSQSGGQTEISKREKELIAATWKQQNDSSAAPKDNAAQAQFLSEAQQKLRDQVNALSVRIQSRDIDQATEEFTDFSKDMQAASAVMGPAADKLKATQWKDALPLEQKALQALLRAEATFRKIEVAFGQQGGAGGGAGAGNSGRDLASLFDLELDTAKNQYETAQTATPAEQHKKEVEDALAKLDALARRQEDLAKQPQNPQQSFQQRWQQEMLRREAEQLEHQMEQMAKNQQSASGSQGQSSSQQGSQQGSQQQQGSSQQNGAQGESGSSGTSGQSQQQSAQAHNGGQSGTQGTRNQSSSQAGQGKSSDQRIEEALSRLNQATDMMKRNSPEQSAEDARAAGERLRQAQNLLAGSQQQLASGQVDSMAREAGRLAQEERSQSDRINQLVKSAQQANSGDAGATSDQMRTLLRERDQLATDRQQLSDDLSKLQRNMRNSQRDLRSNQPEAGKKLRDALTGMDESDLDNHVQRTADWLRSGINPNSNGTEAEIARGLNQLSQQLQQAQSAMTQAKPGDQKERGAGQGDQTAALDRVERLRSELEAMARAQGGGSGQQGQNGNADNRNGQASGTGQLNRDGQGRNGGSNQPSQQQNGANAPNRNGQDGAGGQQSGNRAGNGAQSGNSGDTRPGGGGGNSGSVRDNFDTGNNTPAARGLRQAAPTNASGNPADSERSFDQEMRELRQLRQMVGGDQQATKDVEALTRQMQSLDPSRFPGNPGMVEQMHREVLSSVDRLELELEHANASTDARTGKPDTIPAGYQEQVAEYYRRLSKKQ
jgi:hypothetical protein